MILICLMENSELNVQFVLSPTCPAFAQEEGDSADASVLSAAVRDPRRLLGESWAKMVESVSYFGDYKQMII